jgi:predicted metal-binding transcription factor (methanogenesis marker protein 9)
MKASALEVFLTLIHSTSQSNKITQLLNQEKCFSQSFFCCKISHKCENKIEKVIFFHLSYLLFSKENLLAKFFIKIKI